MKREENHFVKIYNKYQKALKKLSRIRVKNVEGRLIIDRSRNCIEYYHVLRDPNTNKVKRLYINKSKVSLIKKLAQQSYNDKASRLIIRRLRQLKPLITEYKVNELEDLYDKLPEERQVQITPVTPSYSQLISIWLSTPFLSNPYHQEHLKFTTKNGEKVRSKIEKILADKFFDMGIKYKYECPIHLNDKNTFYPDFTFLHPRSHKEIYWEHFGMMNDIEYANKTFKKIEIYAQNGIKTGDNLILTFETLSYSPDDKYIERLIRDNLL